MKDSSKNCEKALDHLLDKLDNIKSASTNEIIDDLIKKYPSCAEELRDKFKIWEDLAKINTPAPSDRMHTNFYAALNELAQPINENKKISSAKNWLVFLIAFIVLFTGFFMYFSNNQKAPTNPPIANEETFIEEIALSESDVEELYKAINNGVTANLRIEKIENIVNITKPDVKIFKALNLALLNDRKINVRLSAIETMLHFTDEELVRNNLIMAIPHQNSPIVQVMLVDAMVSLQEKSALPQIEKLLADGEIEDDVKHYLEDSMKALM